MKKKRVVKKRPWTDRFLEKIKKTDGCWEWTASKNERGYGIFSDEKRVTKTAHRLVYKLLAGSIPPGMHVLHTCDNRGCVNPNHLRLGTHFDNMRDMAAKGRAANQGRGRTECYAGHPYGEDNFYRKRGAKNRQYKICKKCAQESRARRLEELVDEATESTNDKRYGR